jgi:hypothetical protein
MARPTWNSNNPLPGVPEYRISWSRDFWEGEPGSEENIRWVREVFTDMRSFSEGALPQLPGFLEEGEPMVSSACASNA